MIFFDLAIDIVVLSMILSIVSARCLELLVQLPHHIYKNDSDVTNSRYNSVLNEKVMKICAIPGINICITTI